MERERIVLTGGGTAGHVTPCIALLPGLRAMGLEAHYIGGADGMEKELVAQQDIPYYGISAGKLRRYFSLKNVTDVFRVAKGLGDARRALREIKPAAVFSKGGFVTVPVVIAARGLGIPVILHESDFTPGLANRIALPMAAKICVTFPETATHLPPGKTAVTGLPIRAELFAGSRIAGRGLCGFTGEKPVLLAIGGSLGAGAVNDCIRAGLAELTRDYDIAHVCGKGRVAAELDAPGYKQFEYVGKELPHLFQMADVVVSRAGSGAIHELLALAKPNVLIPLSKRASRGDQILNARSFAARGFSQVIEEEALTAAALAAALREVYQNRGRAVAAMRGASGEDALAAVLRVIRETVWPEGHDAEPV